MRLMRTLAVATLLLSPIGAGGQSLLERPPNLSGDWVGAPGTIYFNFVHRFATSDAPERKVSNVPTFLLAAGLPKRLLAGFNYSTNSTLAPRFPNEWELFARWGAVSQDNGAPLDLGAQVGYNNAADGVDGEVSVAKTLGIGRFILAGRALSDPLKAGKTRTAFAGGATIKLNQYVALAGDLASLANRDSTERVAWSAGLHFVIPLTPHSVSLHATNTALTTLQGASRGSSNIRYGFEFTIPLTLRRYFGRDAEPSSDTAVAPLPARVPRVAPSDSTVAPVAAKVPRVASPDTAVAPVAISAPRATPRIVPSPAPAPSRGAPANATVRTAMKNTTFVRPRIQVTVGTTVEWKNNDPLIHTVSAVDKSFDSGLIRPGNTYSHKFTKAGTFNIFCMPHPFMKAVIVVTEP